MYPFPFKAASRHSGRKGRTHRGGLLLEAIISIAIFSIFMSGIGLTMIVGERSTVAGGDRARAAFLAEQGIEGMRAVREAGFTPFTTARVVSPKVQTGSWVLSSGTTTTSDGYITSVQIIPKDADWAEVVSRASWNFGKTRSGSLALSSYITNWRKTLTIGNWNATHSVATLTQSGAPDFRAIAISGNYAYVAAASSTGAGLYVYNITNPAAPSRVSSSFTLGARAYDLVIDGTVLYVATDKSNGEIQRINIKTPTALTADSFSGSYNLPVSAKSLNFFGSTLYVGTVDNLSGPELYTMQLSNTGVLAVRSSLDIGGTVNNISLDDGYAYLSTTYDAGELQVVDVFDPTNLTFAPGRGVDIAEIYDGLSGASFGTAAIIGRAGATSYDELLLYTVAESPVPSPPPGPWSVDTGGDVRALDIEPTGKYLFIGGSTSNAQLRIASMYRFPTAANPLLTSANVSQTVQSLKYDWVKDRLFVVTSSRFIVYAPGT